MMHPTLEETPALSPREKEPETAPLAPLAVAALASAALAACGGGGGGADGGGSASIGTQAASDLPATDADAARFLLQAQFSATDAEIADVRGQGYAAWLSAQYAKDIGTTGVQWLDRQGYGQANAATQFYNVSYPADFMLWAQLFTAPDAVRKRVALALSEIFVASSVGINDPWSAYLVAAYWDVLNANAFGNFRALLEAVTLNPGMGCYLNLRGSRKEDSAGRQPDENYAREVMQLFTIGLYQLNPDGSVQRDGSGNPLPTYGAADVSGLARALTGWDYDRSQNAAITVGTRTLPSTQQTWLPMALNAGQHSALEASFLGVTVPAGTPGAAALKTALDTLFNHPNVGPFFGRQLIQRLVTSNPSPGYVARVAAAFANNGSGARGDMKAVLNAVLLDPEARGAAGLSSLLFGRLREPMLRFVQWGRTFGIASARGTWKIGDASDPATRLAQSPLRSPSVFNFFRPGYVPPFAGLASGMVAPEFQIVTETSVSGFLNFMQGAIRNGLWVGAPDLPQSGSNGNNGFDITCAYANLLPLVADAKALVAKVALLLSANQVGDALQARMVTALQATPVTDSSSSSAKLNRVAAAVLLVMCCPAYLVQK
ncbi:MAG: DUF1800 domain-containing protein [Acidovorax sp.]